MPSISDDLSREEILTFIAKAASFGNLGVFIGAGFSKAVLNDEFDDIALSWGSLLRLSAEKLGIDYDAIEKEGVSYPAIASFICQKISQDKTIDYDKALRRLKRKIADLTSWYPDHTQREKFSQYLQMLSPSWIITTNYDLVIESLLTGKAIPLGPNDSLVAPKSIIPVYHLHGRRTNPEEIIIAQEDYVSLFRPNEYRQIKLALTIMESTTLLIGYGLGDVNVLTALDWSKNVFKSESENYPHAVIQILRMEDAKEDPYLDHNGIIILETDDLTNFFEELSGIRELIVAEEKQEQKRLKSLSKALTDPEKPTIDRFIDNKRFRNKLLENISNSEIYLISPFIAFLKKCIDETWSRSEPSGAFEGYNENLIVILDILTAFSVDQIPPALLEISAHALNRVGSFVGDGGGESWNAHKTWNARKKKLSKGLVRELKNIADQYHYTRLKRLLRDI